ncbi:MAG: TPM domain-containing protein [Planctomycetota bacterium]
MHTLALALVEAGSQGRWEPGAHPFLYQVARFGPWIFVAVGALLVARALLRARRYRALVVFSASEQERVHAALVEAEKHTVGEIVPVVVERSDGHPGASWLAALCTMLVGSALLEAHLPWEAPHWLLLCQLGLGALGYVVAELLPDFKRWFVSDARAEEVAQEQAFQEFHRLKLHATDGATGVLIFVSLFEHRVIVLGDSGIHAQVGDAHWEATRDAITSNVARGQVANGLIEGVRLCGAVLAKHFPWTEGDRNEVPDRMVVRRQ